MKAEFVCANSLLAKGKHNSNYDPLASPESIKETLYTQEVIFSPEEETTIDQLATEENINPHEPINPQTPAAFNINYDPSLLFVQD